MSVAWHLLGTHRALNYVRESLTLRGMGRRPPGALFTLARVSRLGAVLDADSTAESRNSRRAVPEQSRAVSGRDKEGRVQEDHQFSSWW